MSSTAQDPQHYCRQNSVTHTCKIKVPFLAIHLDIWLPQARWEHALYPSCLRVKCFGCVHVIRWDPTWPFLFLKVTYAMKYDLIMRAKPFKFSLRGMRARARQECEISGHFTSLLCLPRFLEQYVKHSCLQCVVGGGGDKFSRGTWTGPRSGEHGGKDSVPQDGLRKLNIMTQELPLESEKGDHFKEKQQKLQPSGGRGDQRE